MARKAPGDAADAGGEGSIGNETRIAPGVFCNTGIDNMWYSDKTIGDKCRKSIASWIRPAFGPFADAFECSPPRRCVSGQCSSSLNVQWAVATRCTKGEPCVLPGGAARRRMWNCYLRA